MEKLKEVIECIIVNVENDRVRARTKLHSDCSSCGLCEGNHAVYYDAINNVGAKCGQSVLLEVEKQNVLKIAFIMFILPLLTIAISSTLSVYLAKFIHSSYGITVVILSLVAFIPLVISIRKYDANVQRKSNIPVITKILNE